MHGAHRGRIPRVDRTRCRGAWHWIGFDCIGQSVIVGIGLVDARTRRVLLEGIVEAVQIPIVQPVRHPVAVGIGRPGQVDVEAQRGVGAPGLVLGLVAETVPVGVARGALGAAGVGVIQPAQNLPPVREAVAIRVAVRRRNLDGESRRGLDHVGAQHAATETRRVSPAVHPVLTRSDREVLHLPPRPCRVPAGSCRIGRIVKREVANHRTEAQRIQAQRRPGNRRDVDHAVEEGDLIHVACETGADAGVVHARRADGLRAARGQYEGNLDAVKVDGEFARCCAEGHGHMSPVVQRHDAGRQRCHDEDIRRSVRRREACAQTAVGHQLEPVVVLAGVDDALKDRRAHSRCCRRTYPGGHREIREDVAIAERNDARHLEIAGQCTVQLHDAVVEGLGADRRIGEAAHLDAVADVVVVRIDQSGIGAVDVLLVLVGEAVTVGVFPVVANAVAIGVLHGRIGPGQHFAVVGETVQIDIRRSVGGRQIAEVAELPRIGQSISVCVCTCAIGRPPHSGRVALKGHARRAVGTGRGKLDIRNADADGRRVPPTGRGLRVLCVGPHVAGARERIAGITAVDSVLQIGATVGLDQLPREVVVHLLLDRQRAAEEREVDVLDIDAATANHAKVRVVIRVPEIQHLGRIRRIRDLEILIVATLDRIHLDHQRAAVERKHGGQIVHGDPRPTHAGRSLEVGHAVHETATGHQIVGRDGRVDHRITAGPDIVVVEVGPAHQIVSLFVREQRHAEVLGGGRRVRIPVRVVDTAGADAAGLTAAVQRTDLERDCERDVGVTADERPDLPGRSTESRPPFRTGRGRIDWIAVHVLHRRRALDLGKVLALIPQGDDVFHVAVPTEHAGRRSVRGVVRLPLQFATAVEISVEVGIAQARRVDVYARHAGPAMRDELQRHHIRAVIALATQSIEAVRPGSGGHVVARAVPTCRTFDVMAPDCLVPRRGHLAEPSVAPRNVDRVGPCVLGKRIIRTSRLPDQRLAVQIVTVEMVDRRRHVTVLGLAIEGPRAFGNPPVGRPRVARCVARDSCDTARIRRGRRGTSAEDCRVPVSPRCIARPRIPSAARIHRRPDQTAGEWIDGSGGGFQRT